MHYFWLFLPNQNLCFCIAYIKYVKPRSLYIASIERVEVIIGCFSTMAYCRSLDVYSWIQNLPPISEWKTGSMSLSLCSVTNSSSQPSLNLTISKNNHQSPNKLFFAIVADFNIPIFLWTSKPLKHSSTKSTKTKNKLADEETICNLFVNFIQDVLHYSSNKKNSSLFIKFPKLESIHNFPEIFNLAFLTLFFLVCIYEAPADLRSGCLNTIKDQLANCQSRQALKLLMKLLGSNLEEQWMRSVNLAITNWIVELQQAQYHHSTLIRTPSPLFSYSFSTLFGLWKVQLYCPVINMDMVNANNHPADERLQFSLRYQQLEGVLQFNYKVIVKEKWVEIMVNIDNIR